MTMCLSPRGMPVRADAEIVVRIRELQSQDFLGWLTGDLIGMITPSAKKGRPT